MYRENAYAVLFFCYFTGQNAHNFCKKVKMEAGNVKI